jgi:hypothetical protein
MKLEVAKQQVGPAFTTLITFLFSIPVFHFKETAFILSKPKPLLAN